MRSLRHEDGRWTRPEDTRAGKVNSKAVTLRRRWVVGSENKDRNIERFLEEKTQASNLRRYNCNVSPPKRHLRRGTSEEAPPPKRHLRSTSEELAEAPLATSPTICYCMKTHKLFPRGPKHTDMARHNYTSLGWVFKPHYTCTTERGHVPKDSPPFRALGVKGLCQPLAAPALRLPNGSWRHVRPGRQPPASA